MSNEKINIVSMIRYFIDRFNGCVDGVNILHRQIRPTKGPTIILLKHVDMRATLCNNWFKNKKKGVGHVHTIVDYYFGIVSFVGDEVDVRTGN